MTPTIANLATDNDPVLDRAAFFFELELLELSAKIPQAAPRGVIRY